MSDGRSTRRRDRPHRATFRFEAEPDPRNPASAEREARLVADAIGVEVGEIDDDRSRATVSSEGGVVEVTVAAADLVALRAAANTWTGLVEVAEATTALGRDPADVARHPDSDADRGTDPDPDTDRGTGPDPDAEADADPE